MVQRQNQSITFRPVKSEEELEAMFRLRYEVYEASRLRPLLSFNLDRLDIDSYDVNSHHLGLFAGEMPIGCARLITLMQSPQSEWVESVSNRLGIFCEDGIAGLPTLHQTYKGPNPTDWIGNEKTIEPSRVCIRPGWRSRKLATFLANGLISYSLAMGYETAILNCHRSHVRMWQSIGSMPTAAIPDFTYRGLTLTALLLKNSWLPSHVKDTVVRGTADILRSGAIELVDDAVQFSETGAMAA